MTAVLSIDQGTSGTKAIVVADGEVVARVEVAVTPRYLADGGVEIDATELLRSVIDTGSRAVEESGVDIDVVALANQGETVLPWDLSTGEPLGPAIVWQDRRSESICADRSDSKEHVEQRTGLVLDPYFSAPKMRWIRENITGQGVVTSSDTWLVHQLTGAFVTDASTASRSLLVDLDEQDWSADLLEVFGLEEESLPQIVGSDEIVGSTTVFGGTIAVGGLIVDQQAALLAQSCIDPGTAKCTYGTGAFLLGQVGGTPVRSRAGLATSVAWRLRGETSHCLDGQIYTVASAVRWLQDLGIIAGADELDQVAAKESSGVLCSPALAGLAAPWWDSSASGMFTGLRLGTGRPELVKAFVEGIAAQIAILLRLMQDDLDAAIPALRVDGGLTRSRALMQAQADIAQVPVEIYPSPDATALGAAACGRLSIEADLDVRSSSPSWTPVETFEPRWSADRAVEFIDRWTTMAASTHQSPHRTEQS